jgi:hypothetical protein
MHKEEESKTHQGTFADDGFLFLRRKLALGKTNVRNLLGQVTFHLSVENVIRSTRLLCSLAYSLQ